MGRTNTRRESIYSIYRNELSKYKATKGTVFAHPFPVASEYGLSEWEGMQLCRQEGVEYREPDPF